MTTIRKQSIISSGVVYLGFGLGAIINLILTREFSPDQYGLISGMFLALGTILYSVASGGMPAVIVIFYPNNNYNVPLKNHDLMTWALLITLTGFGLAMLAGIIFRDQVIHYYRERSRPLSLIIIGSFRLRCRVSLFTRCSSIMAGSVKNRC